MANSIMVVERVGEIDLLQQALAGAADDITDNTTLQNQHALNQTELLNILQGDSSDSQTIQLTTEQAAVLGLHVKAPESSISTIKEENDIADDTSTQKFNVNIDSTAMIGSSANEATFNIAKIPMVLNEMETIPSSVTDVIKSVIIDPAQPLGTTKNHIQLVQKNGFVKGIQELTPEQLSMLQVVLQKHSCQLKIESPGDVTFYRTIYPEDLDLQTPRRGRPPLKRGRPKKSTIDKPSSEREVSPEVPIAKPIRTRSGRVTKPPRHKHFRPLREIDVQENFNDTDASDTSETTALNETEFQVENKTAKTTTEAAENKTITKQVEEEFKPPVLLSGLPHQKRNISAQFRCPTCKKAYVGYSRMERHLKLFPDHGPLPIKRQTTSLWETSLKLARSAPIGSRGIALLNDLESLIKNLQKVAPFLIQTYDQKGPPYEINETLAHILKIPPGKYTVNESVIFENSIVPSTTTNSATGSKSNDTVDNGGISNTNAEINTSINESNVIIANKSTVTESNATVTNTESKLEVNQPSDTGQSMVVDAHIHSDELISVDQLVNERLHSLTADELAAPNVNGTSTPLNLDLSLDLFQFNPS